MCRLCRGRGQSTDEEGRQAGEANGLRVQEGGVLGASTGSRDWNVGIGGGSRLRDKSPRKRLCKDVPGWLPVGAEGAALNRTRPGTVPQTRHTPGFVS